MIRRITVTVAVPSLWGSTDPEAEGYDAHASEHRYATMLCKALDAEYPRTYIEVNISHDTNEIEIDTDDDVEHDVALISISQAGADLFESGAWIAMQADAQTY
jgi:hypothetical protein